MIYIYTDEKYIKNGKKTLISNDTYFNSVIEASWIDKKCEDWILKIDRAVMIDKQIGNIQTPYGITSLESISTGLKTLINIYKLIADGIQYNACATECGANVLEELFELVDGTDMRILFKGIEVTGLKREFDYMINDKIKVTGTERLADQLLSLMGGNIK